MQVNFGAPVPDKAGPECLIYSESWDYMQNVTPVILMIPETPIG